MDQQTIKAEEPVLLSWSGGKDCALALTVILGSSTARVTLLTTVAEGYRRVSMHGIREELLDAQAASLGLPLEKVKIPTSCSMDQYSAIMRAVTERYHDLGYLKVVFGDIFLEDVRRYRETNLSEVGMTAVFPLWERGSREVARAIIDGGYRAITSCVDTRVLDGSLAGREYDDEFLKALPPAVDPCGENGEFHTFIFAGPVFKSRIGFRKGEIVLRENRFSYCDLIPE